MQQISKDEQARVPKFQQWFVRFSLLTLLLGFFFLIFTLLDLLSRLDTLAPVELRLLLEIVKNRFFR